MCMVDNAEYDAERLLADREALLMFLQTAVNKNPIRADTLARLLFIAKEAIETDPDNLEPAINTLLDGIELAYLHTDEHRLALKLYMLYLTGHLKPQDEPLTLLKGAIERGTAEIERARKTGVPARYKLTGKRNTLKKKQ